MLYNDIIISLNHLMQPKYAVLQKVRNQKRTYGVTPHIPGGFIKADDL